MMTSRDPYESECFSFMGNTTSSEPPTSTEAQSPSRASMMSPMPGPMAFTIDFGAGDSGEAETKRKLSLRDGIKRFAPTKKKPVNPPANAPVNPPGTPPIHTPPMTTTANTKIAIQPNTNTELDKKALISSLQTGTRVMVDVDNNIALTSDNRHVITSHGGDAASEAGTYTIDQDDDADAEEEIDEELKRAPKSKSSIGDKFSVREDQWSTRDWVDRWASSSLPTAMGATDLDEDDDDFEEEEEDHSFMSLRDPEGGRSRRRLPPTPMRLAEKGSTMSNGGTDDCLQDTISLMAAMEARLGGESESQSKASKPAPEKRQTQTPAKKAPLSNPAPAKATNKANKAAERMAAWQRRKNYDPLKAAATNGKINQNPGRSRQSPSQSLTEESFSESCSDVDLHCEPTPPPHRGPVFATQVAHSALKPSPSHNNHDNTKNLAAARPNRAFALRQTNSMVTSTHSAVERTPSKSDLGRGDSNRFTSLSSSVNRTTTTKSQLTPSLSALSGSKKMSPGVLAAVKSGRSTSSLSSKEAEYQAWKRRKNYNPLRSAAAGGGPAKKEPVRSAPPSASRTTGTTSSSTNTSLVSGRRMSAVDEAEDNIHRSASFHYPDGLSRVHHNVFTSEDEDCEPSIIKSGLYEINDDELVLAIGRAPSTENGVYLPNRKGGLRSSPSRSSPSRLEALDNLVISTIFSVSTKLCLTSGKLIRRLQDNTNDKEQLAYLDTLLYVLEDVEPPISPSKKTSRELAGTLRNLKKVEQALQTLDRLSEQDM